MSQSPSRHDAAQNQNPNTSQIVVGPFQEQDNIVEVGNKPLQGEKPGGKFQKSDFKTAQISSLHGDLQN